MSLDGKDPASTWRAPLDAADPDRKQSMNQAQLADQQAPLPPIQEDEADAQDVQLDPQLEDFVNQGDTDNAAGAIPPLSELLAQFGQYLALILAPLLFALLTFLVVLARITSHEGGVPSQALLPVTFVIIAIAVAQGVAVYYAGIANRMWIPGTLGGLCLFLLVGSFAGFGPVVAVIVLILLIAGILALVRFYLKKIPEGTIAIVHSMGKFSNILYPGPNILYPWEEITHRLQTRETQWLSPTQRVQMSQETDVTLRAMIAYQLVPEYAYLALDHVDQWEESLRAIFVTSIQTVATTFKPGDLVSWSHNTRNTAASRDEQIARWEQINNYLFQQVRDRVDLWGVEVKWVRIRDVVLVPHGAPVMDTEPIENAEGISASTAAIADEPTVALPKEVVAQQDAAAAAARKQRLEQLDEDTLITAYKTVQDGKITAPETIREIAHQFEQIADDPALSQAVSFDAARAARNLYDQALKYEQSEQGAQSQMTYSMPVVYSDDAKTGWPSRGPKDENIMAGG